MIGSPLRLHISNGWQARAWFPGTLWLWLYAKHHTIKLLESPIPATATTATAASSQKAHFDNISGTKRGTIDPLVSNRGPEGP